jgi:hypothetical protein
MKRRSGAGGGLAYPDDLADKITTGNARRGPAATCRRCDGTRHAGGWR